MMKYELTQKVAQYACSAFFLNLPQKQLVLDRLVYHTRSAFYYCYDNNLFIQCKISKKQHETQRRNTYCYKFCRKIFEHTLPQEFIEKILDINQQLRKQREKLGEAMNQRIKKINIPIYGALIYKFYLQEGKTKNKGLTEDEEALLKQIESGEYEMMKEFQQLKKILTMNIKVLLVECSNTGKFGYPKGKIDEDEEPHQCAIREVYEETSYRVKADLKNFIVSGLSPQSNCPKIQPIFFVIDGSELDESVVENLNFSEYNENTEDWIEFHWYKNRFEIKSVQWCDIQEEVKDPESSRINLFSRIAYREFESKMQERCEGLKKMVAQTLKKLKLNAQHEAQQIQLLKIPPKPLPPLILKKKHSKQKQNRKPHKNPNNYNTRSSGKKVKPKYIAKYPQKQDRLTRNSRSKNKLDRKYRLKFQQKFQKFEKSTKQETLKSKNTRQLSKKKYVEKYQRWGQK